MLESCRDDVGITSGSCRGNKLCQFFNVGIMSEHQTLSNFSVGITSEPCRGNRLFIFQSVQCRDYIGGCWDHVGATSCQFFQCRDRVGVCRNCVGAPNFVKFFNVQIMLGYVGIMSEHQTLSNFSVDIMSGPHQDMLGSCWNN